MERGKKKKKNEKIHFGVNLDICEKEKATYIVCNEIVVLLYICTKWYNRIQEMGVQVRWCIVVPTYPSRLN